MLLGVEMRLTNSVIVKHVCCELNSERHFGNVEIHRA